MHKHCSNCTLSWHSIFLVPEFKGTLIFFPNHFGNISASMKHFLYFCKKILFFCWLFWIMKFLIYTVGLLFQCVVIQICSSHFKCYMPHHVFTDWCKKMVSFKVIIFQGLFLPNAHVYLIIIIVSKLCSLKYDTYREAFKPEKTICVVAVHCLRLWLIQTFCHKLQF